MTECIRVPTRADIGTARVVIDKRGFRHLGKLLGFDLRGWLIMRSTAVQIGLTSLGRTWDLHEGRIETIEGARIIDG